MSNQKPDRVDLSWLLGSQPGMGMKMLGFVLDCALAVQCVGRFSLAAAVLGLMTFAECRLHRKMVLEVELLRCVFACKCELRV